MSGSGRARNYLFTVFAPFGEDELRLLPVEEWPEWVTYVIYQRELCPDTLREHFQGYLELSTPRTYSTLQADLAGLETAHFEVRRGSQAQAIAYCSKAESQIEGPWQTGEKKNQGAREDLKRAQADLDAGKSMYELAKEHFEVFVKYHGGLTKYRRLVAQPRHWAMEIIVIVGPSGTGKSRQAFQMAPGAYVKDRGMWWDNYEGQHTVVWDEFYGASYPFNSLLRLLDRYPFSVECKGATLEFTSHRIIFTTNQEPEFWYDSERTHSGPWETNPLNRRLREFGRIIRTGAVHVAPAVRRLPFRREFLYGENEMNFL